MRNLYNPEYVKGLFNKMSGSYERVNYITSFGFSLKWRRQFLDCFQKSNEKIKVIDLMTGMGEAWQPLKKHFPNSELYGLDFSVGMLKQAGEKNAKSFDNKVKLLNQNILDNELPNDSFDIVVSAFGLKTFDEDQIRILAYETMRILKKDGKFSFIEVSEPNNKLLRFLYKTHLKYIVPFFGRVLLGNPSEYKMLWQYTNSFKNSNNVVEIFRQEGLLVKEESYFGGCASGLSGKK